MKKPGKYQISTITVFSQIDNDPDTSWLGEYVDSPDYGVISRSTGEYCDKVFQRQSIIEALEYWIDNINNPDQISRLKKRVQKIKDSGDTDFPYYFSPEPRFFKPSPGFEPLKRGDKEAYKNGMQAYQRMEGLSNGDWCFIGITAVAVIWNKETRITQRITAGGLWGIESDSDKAYLESVARDQIAELKAELLSLGIGSRAIEYALKTKYDSTIHEKG